VDLVVGVELTPIRHLNHGNLIPHRYGDANHFPRYMDDIGYVLLGMHVSVWCIALLSGPALITPGFCF
jgi:hypothetical protein